jgi:hypothetical protein
MLNKFDTVIVPVGCEIAMRMAAAKPGSVIV